MVTLETPTAIAEALDRATLGERVTVTRQGEAVAALVPLADLALLEGADSDADQDGEPEYAALEGEERARFIQSLHEARSEIARGEGMTNEEAQREMDAYVASRLDEMRSRRG